MSEFGTEFLSDNKILFFTKFMLEPSLMRGLSRLLFPA